MTISKSLSLSILTFALTTITYAEDNIAFNNSVLPPGAKIVAGDLSQGEFFIVAQNESAKIKPLPPVAEPSGKEPFVPAVRMALSKTISPKPKPAPVVTAEESIQTVQPTPSVKFAKANLPRLQDKSPLEKKLKPLIKTALNKNSQKNPPVFEVIHARKVGKGYQFVTHKQAYDNHKHFKDKQNKEKNKIANKSIHESKKLAQKIKTNNRVEKRKLALKNNISKNKKLILAKK